ncbi:MAG TPA: hypothetical protein VNQ73_03605 [Ilumatobacter sp.]|nr:hypothetical protein [Ilumatobacter sp.]
MELTALESLTGHRFPGGGFAIEPYEDWLMRDVLGAPAGDGTRAHPIWAFAAPQQSMGVTIDEIFELCGSSAADGPMLGDSSIELAEPLRLGHRYVVSGSIVAASRKRGRTVGTFDVVTFVADTTDAAGAPAARLTNSFVFPRPGEP